MQIVMRRLCGVLVLLGLFVTTSPAQFRTRLYACALASDEPGAFMGGSSIGAGLWTSDDSGATWKHLGWSHVKCYSVAIVDSSFGDLLYLACGNGLMRSTDAGVHWRMLTDWRIAEVMDVAVDERNVSHLTIATATGNWSSIDSGEHWSEVGPRDYRAHLFYDSSDGHISDLNACRRSDGAIASLTTDGAVRIGSKQIVRPLSKRGGVWCIGESAKTLYLGGERGVYHVDTANVTHMIAGSPRNAHGIVSVGPTFLIGSLSGGVWRASAGDKDIEFMQVGLPSLQVWSLHTALVRE
jgi:hypothetical protein